MNRNECDAIRPLISAALDGDLDEHEFVRLSEHLASCNDCRQVHQDYFQLRNSFRSTPPPTPPPQLAKDVWKETVEKPQPAAIVRLFTDTRVRFGMSTMAASIVALLAAVLFIAHGYDQRSIPTVASSQPEQGSTQDWPVSRPVEIEFSKQMNRDSVEENLIIWPSSEQDRLPISWSGNTLIIGRSEEQSVLLRPETDYRITILEHAEDHHGNAIGDFWVLQFRTGQPEVAISTPSPDSGQSREDQRLDESSSSAWMFGQGEDDDDADADADDDAEVSDDQGGSGQESQSENTGDSAGGSTETERDQQSQEQEQEQSTSDQREQEQASPTSEPEPKPAELQPTAEPEPTATPRPDPTPEPTATPEPEPDPSSTPKPYGVRGAFGEVYWGNSSIKDALGDPVQEARTIQASEQEFQRGMMFRQHGQTRNAIFVFINGDAVRTFSNDYDPAVHDYPVEAQDDGLYRPGGYFGKVWSERSSVAQAIGYAISESPVEDIEAGIQQFDRGTLLYSRGSVYVIYGDGSWEVITVRSDSDGGFQSDDPERETNGPDDSTVPGDSESDDTGESNDPDDAEFADDGADADENP